MKQNVIFNIFPVWLRNRLYNMRWIRTSSQPYWKIMYSIVLQTFCEKNYYFSMASKPINIFWNRSGSQQYWKIMHNIILQTIFHEYWNKNHKIKSRFVSLDLWPLGANKTSLNLIIFQFNIRRKLSIKPCEI